MVTVTKKPVVALCVKDGRLLTPFPGSYPSLSHHPGWKAGPDLAHRAPQRLLPSPATCSGLAERQPRQAARWAQHRRVTFLGCLFLPLHCCVLQHQGQLQTNPEPTQSRVLMLICHAVAQTSSFLAPQGWGPPGGWWSRCTAQHYSLIRQVCPEDLWCASRGRRVL